MKKENLHLNHRARMRGRLFSAGSGSLCDHELLEMFLYNSDRRKDTNATAHRLINRFGSLKGVITADEGELRSVEGVNEPAVASIVVLRELMRRIDVGDRKVPPSFESIEDMYKYIAELYKYSSEEEMHLMLFDKSMRVIDCILVKKGDGDSVRPNMKMMAQTVFERDAAGIVLSHNHLNGNLIPSGEDVWLTRDICGAFNAFGIEVIDHVLVAGGACVSVMKTGGFR